MTNDFKPRGNELDWLGPKDETKHLVYHMQTVDADWYATAEHLELDPNYSDFSVRIHWPGMRSLSFIYRTLAILPKSKLRDIYNLIGAYLERVDNNAST